MSDGALTGGHTVEHTSAATRAESLLLRAALRQGDDAASAWRAWLATEDLDDVDSRSFALLPLVCHNLQAHGVTDGPMGRLRGILRQSWYKNQLRLADLAEAVRTVAQAGTDCLVIGDAAFAARIYPQPGLRPIEQIDLLVRPADAGAAQRALAAAGWQPAYPARDLTRQMAIRPYGLFNNARRAPLRLHWRMVAPEHDASVEDAPWAAAQPVDLAGAPARTLHAASLLLHACTQGAQQPAPLALIWLADCAVLLRGWAAELDTGHATALLGPAQLGAAAANLRQAQLTAGIASLPAWLASEAHARSARSAANDAPPASSVPPNASAPARLAAAWRRYRQLPPASRRLFAPLGFAAYLQSWWNLEHAAQLPGAALRRLARPPAPAAHTAHRRTGVPPSSAAAADTVE